MANLQDLPNEVLERIAVHVRYMHYNTLGEYDDLRSLCLVSRHFAAIVRRVLYQDVRIWNYTPEVPYKYKLGSFVRTILTVPGVAMRVRRLNLNCEPAHITMTNIQAARSSSGATLAGSRVSWSYLLISSRIVNQGSFLDPNHPLNPSCTVLESLRPKVRFMDLFDAAVKQADIRTGTASDAHVLNFSLYHNPTAALMTVLLFYLPKLEVLQLGRESSDDDTVVQAVVTAKSQSIETSERRWVKLSEMTFHGVSPSSSAVFARLPSMRSFRFVDCSLIESALNKSPLNDANIEHLPLTSVYIEDCKIDVSSLASFLRCCSSLQCLHIKDSSFEGNKVMTPLGDALRHAASGSLRTLEVSQGYDYATTPGSLGSFQNFTRLEKMVLMFSRLLSGASPGNNSAALLPQQIVSVSLALHKKEDKQTLWQHIRGILALKQRSGLALLERLELVVKCSELRDRYANRRSLENNHRALREDFAKLGVDLRLLF